MTHRTLLSLLVGFALGLAALDARADFGPAQGAASGGGAGDIESITVGAGLTGGGTEGDISIAASVAGWESVTKGAVADVSSNDIVSLGSAQYSFPDGVRSSQFMAYSSDGTNSAGFKWHSTYPGGFKVVDASGSTSSLFAAIVWCDSALVVGADDISLNANDTTVRIRASNGSPEGAETAPVGSICMDYTNGVLYVKRTGAGNTGWQALDDLD